MSPLWRSSNRRSCGRGGEDFVASMRPHRLCLRRAFSAASSPAPVLVVGAGPVGLTLSILLSQYGVPSFAVDNRSRLSEYPQAHFLNNRTMEIFRKMEGLTAEIEAKQPPVEQ